ncbi:lactate dehydrogenase [Streptomyces sp. NBC_01471]|uniref:lactate dehydrogenase n=1 Tax=Streptomyces sp. NBC_01471 TaxID=2903879 RepID=UPI00324E9EC8
MLAAGLVAAAFPARLLVVSRQPDQTRALTTDLQDLALASRSRTQAGAGEVAHLHAWDAVVVALRTDFKNTAEQDIRRQGATANAPACGYDGTVIIVTNPVDLMARRFAEVPGCARAFGIGANLDSARCRFLLARYAQVSPDRVLGHVIGEHGDRAVICVSTTTVDRRPVAVPVRAVVADLQRRPALIRHGIGRTRCGPDGAVLSTLRMAGPPAFCTTSRAPWYSGGSAASSMPGSRSGIIHTVRPPTCADTGTAAACASVICSFIRCKTRSATASSSRSVRTSSSCLASYSSSPSSSARRAAIRSSTSGSVMPGS